MKQMTSKFARRTLVLLLGILPMVVSAQHHNRPPHGGGGHHHGGGHVSPYGQQVSQYVGREIYQFGVYLH